MCVCVCVCVCVCETKRIYDSGYLYKDIRVSCGKVRICYQSIINQRVLVNCLFNCEKIKDAKEASLERKENNFHFKKFHKRKNIGVQFNDATEKTQFE